MPSKIHHYSPNLLAKLAIPRNSPFNNSSTIHPPIYLYINRPNQSRQSAPDQSVRQFYLPLPPLYGRATLAIEMGNRLETRMCVCMCVSQSRGPTIIHSSTFLHDEGEKGRTRGNPFGTVRFIREYRYGGKVGKYALLVSFEWQMAKFRPPEFFFSPIPSRHCIFFPSLFPSPLPSFFSFLALVSFSFSFPSFLITFHVYRWRNHDSFVTRNSCVNRDKWTERKISRRDWNSSLLIAVFGIFNSSSLQEGFVFVLIEMDYYLLWYIGLKVTSYTVFLPTNFELSVLIIFFFEKKFFFCNSSDELNSNVAGCRDIL